MKKTNQGFLVIILIILLISTVYFVSQYMNSNQTKLKPELKILNFHSNLNEALNQSQLENKPILTYIRSDTCKWCEKFESTTLNDERINLLLYEKFVLESVDFNQLDKQQKTNLKVNGTPAFFFLTPRGNEISGSRLDGYVDADSFLKYLNETLKSFNIDDRINDAFIKAELGNKSIYLYIYSNKCPYCKKFESEILNDTKIQTILDEHFVLVKIEVNEFSKKMQTLNIEKTPTSIFIKSNGREIQNSRINGFVEYDIFEKHLNQLIENKLPT